MSNDLLLAICGAILSILIFWLIYSTVCFAEACAEVKPIECNMDICYEPISKLELGLICRSVDHMSLKQHRGYSWGGGCML